MDLGGDPQSARGGLLQSILRQKKPRLLFHRLQIRTNIPGPMQKPYLPRLIRHRRTQGLTLLDKFYYLMGLRQATCRGKGSYSALLTYAVQSALGGLRD